VTEGWSPGVSNQFPRIWLAQFLRPLITLSILTFVLLWRGESWRSVGFRKPYQLARFLRHVMLGMLAMVSVAYLIRHFVISPLHLHDSVPLQGLQNNGTEFATLLVLVPFAQLSAIAPVYTHYPVLDATGLEGAWDFTLTFSPIPPEQLAAVRRGGRGASKGGPGVRGDAAALVAGVASDPAGGISLGNALNKQLGLRLEMRKRTAPVLVIDHIEEKPTDD
jgi:hypothetical protein